MSDARSSIFDFDLTKIFADLRLRPLDVEAVWAAQRRNIEAFSQANQVAVEGVHAVAKRQIELTQQTLEDLSSWVREMAQPVSAEDRIAKQTEYTKKMIDKGLAHGREVAALAAKAGAEASEVLQRRTTEGLDELRAFTCKSAPSATVVAAAAK
ncbi:MAG: phasin family protein [Alphaproteobacteria bacterium]|nr:phasin family protein [Alphaproteobacteria bacterium]